MFHSQNKSDSILHELDIGCRKEVLSKPSLISGFVVSKIVEIAFSEAAMHIDSFPCLKVIILSLE